MAGENGHWSEPVRLGDLVQITHGWPFKSQFFSEELTGKPIVVNIGNFEYTGGFRFQSTTVKEYRSDYPPEYELKPNDILLVMTCQTAGGEILGIPGRIPNDGRTYLHNQRMGKVVIKEPSLVDPDFLYWMFLWSEFNRELYVSASGTKILHTAPKRIEAFKFRLPPLSEQKAIAEILGGLDAKIELNRRMNETLESLARALFKSWFVDFDPVRAKLDGRQPPNLPPATLVPDSFEHGPDGELLPRGWNLLPLREIAELQSGGTPKKSNEAFWNGTIPWISPKAMTTIHAFNSHERVTADAVGNGTRLVPAGTVLVMVRGMGLHQGVRISQARRDVTFNQDVKALVPSSVDGTFLLFALLDASPFLFNKVQASGHGTGVLPTDIIQSLEFAVPPAETRDKLIEPLTHLNDRIAANERESETLAALRDTLLPRLLSGELRVADAERAVEDVT